MLKFSSISPKSIYIRSAGNRKKTFSRNLLHWRSIDNYGYNIVVGENGNKKN